MNSRNSENNSNEELSPYESSPAWIVEQQLLYIYSLLVHRINGLGWSLEDFWNTDTWTTSFLYCMELDIIREEDIAINGDKEEYHDSDEAKDMMEEMFGVES